MDFITEAELRQPPASVFQLLDKVGEGSFGTVFKAKHIASGKICAVKQIPADNDLEETIKEITTMTGFASDHLVKFYGSSLDLTPVGTIEIPMRSFLPH